MSDALRNRFDEIEREICEGRHTAASVFTQMRTAALYPAPQPAAPALSRKSVIDVLLSTRGQSEGVTADAILSLCVPEHDGPTGDHVPDYAFEEEFSEWWQEEGQYVRSGGGEYERIFAFEAWRHLYPRIVAHAAPDVSGLVEALATIRDWSAFPETGKTWESGQPMSYGACFGSNGERDFMRKVAADALAAHQYKEGDA